MFYSDKLYPAPGSVLPRVPLPTGSVRRVLEPGAFYVRGARAGQLTVDPSMRPVDT